MLDGMGVSLKMIEMNKIRSRILLRLMQGFGKQPWWMLHFEASVIAGFMAIVGGYRKGVVLGNLIKVFGSENIQTLSKGFYKNFCDITLESMKLFSAKDHSIISRVEYSEEGVTLMNRLQREGRHVILVGAHMANWEMYAMTLSRVIEHKTMALYKKLSDPIMDDAMRKSRQRMGLEMIEIEECKTWMDNHVSEGGEPVAVGFGFDQSPQDPMRAWWTTFLGVETPVYFGAEQWANTYDAAVVYGAVRRTGRGRYRVEFRLVEEHVKALNKGHVLDKCLGELEEEILNAPSDWLWSHKRWKHQMPEGIQLQKRMFERTLES